MAILARGSQIPWEAKQSARDEYIRFKDNNVIEMKLVRGQMYKGEVQRTELRVKELFPNGLALKLKEAFKFTLLTDVNFEGDLVIAQCPWDGGSPDNSIRIDTKTKRMYYLNYNQRGRVKRREITLVPTVKVGQEYAIVYRMDGQSNASGWVEVYVDGVKKVDLKGQNIFPPTDPDSYPKLGGYLGDDDLPPGLNEIVMQFRDVTFGSPDATYEELSRGATSEPEPEPELEPEPDPKPEPEPQPEPEEPTFTLTEAEKEAIEVAMNRISFNVSLIRDIMDR